MSQWRVTSRLRGAGDSHAMHQWKDTCNLIDRGRGSVHVQNEGMWPRFPAIWLVHQRQPKLRTHVSPEGLVTPKRVPCGEPKMEAWFPKGHYFSIVKNPLGCVPPIYFVCAFQGQRYLSDKIKVKLAPHILLSSLSKQTTFATVYCDNHKSVLAWWILCNLWNVLQFHVVVKLK